MERAKFNYLLLASPPLADVSGLKDVNHVGQHRISESSKWGARRLNREAL